MTKKTTATGNKKLVNSAGEKKLYRDLPMGVYQSTNRYGHFSSFGVRYEYGKKRADLFINKKTCLPAVYPHRRNWARVSEFHPR